MATTGLLSQKSGMKKTGTESFSIGPKVDAKQDTVSSSTLTKPYAPDKYSGFKPKTATESASISNSTNMTQDQVAASRGGTIVNNKFVPDTKINTTNQTNNVSSSKPYAPDKTSSYVPQTATESAPPAKTEQQLIDEKTPWNNYDHGQDWLGKRANEYAIQSAVGNPSDFNLRDFKLGAQASHKYNQQQLNNIQDVWQQRQNAMYAAGRRGVTGAELKAIGDSYINELKGQYDFGYTPSKPVGQASQTQNQTFYSGGSPTFDETAGAYNQQIDDIGQQNEAVRQQAIQNGATQEQLFNLSQNQELNTLKMQIANGLIPQEQAQAALQNLANQHQQQRASFQGGMANLGGGNVSQGILTGNGMVNLGGGNITAGSVGGAGMYSLGGGNINTGTIWTGGDSNLKNTVAGQGGGLLTPQTMPNGQTIPQGGFNQGQGDRTAEEYLQDHRSPYGATDLKYRPKMKFDSINTSWQLNGKPLSNQEGSKVTESMMGMLTADGAYADRTLKRNPQLKKIIAENPDWRERMMAHLGEVAMANLSGFNPHAGYKDYGKGLRTEGAKGLTEWWKAVTPDWQQQLANFKQNYINQFEANRNGA